MPVVTPATGGVSHNATPFGGGCGGVCVGKHGRALVFAIDPSTKELRVLLGEGKEAGGKKKGVSCLGGGRGEAKAVAYGAEGMKDGVRPVDVIGERGGEKRGGGVEG